MEDYVTRDAIIEYAKISAYAAKCESLALTYLLTGSVMVCLALAMSNVSPVWLWMTVPAAVHWWFAWRYTQECNMAVRELVRLTQGGNDVNNR